MKMKLKMISIMIPLPVRTLAFEIYQIPIKEFIEILLRPLFLGDTKLKWNINKINTYNIDIIKFRDIDTSDYLQSLSQKEIELINENFPVCMHEIHNEFQKVEYILIKIINISDMDLKFTEYYQETKNLLVRTEEDLEKFEKDAFTEIEKFSSENDVNVLYLTLLRK